MTKREIFDLEKENADKIHLFLEGTFWIAYERSPFRFVRSIRPYRAKRKFIKTVGEEVVSLGFPDSALAAITAAGGLEVVDRTEKRIALRAPEAFAEAEFGLWKSGTETFVPASSPKRNAGGGATEPAPPEAAPAPPASTEEIMGLIRRFGVESKTPIECMCFLSELKNRVNEIR